MEIRSNHFTVTRPRGPISLACRAIFHTDTVAIGLVTQAAAIMIEMLTNHCVLAGLEEMERGYLRLLKKVDLDPDSEEESRDH
jgi:hypothetical protein